MRLSKTFNVGQLLGGAQAHEPTPQQRERQSLVGVLRDILTALRGNLTLGDNVVGQFSTIQITTSSTYSGGSFSTIVVPWNFASKKAPQSVLIGQIIVPSSQAVLTTSQSVQWSYDSVKEVVNISYISGLNNNSEYTVTLEVK